LAHFLRGNSKPALFSALYHWPVNLYF